MKPLLVRILSFLIVLGVLWTQPQHYYLLIFGIGFSHFLIALYFCPKRIKTAISHSPGLYAGLILSILMGVAFYWDTQLAFFLAFSSHLALNETYDAFHERIPDKPFYLFRFLFHMACYFTATYADYPYFKDANALVMLAPLFFLLPSAYLGRGKKNIHLWGDLFTFILVCLIVYNRQILPYRIPLLLGLYHFSYWLIAPVVYHPDWKNMKMMVGNVILSSLLTITMWFVIKDNRAQVMTFAFGYTLFAYIHTILSIPGSYSNPAWVTNFFHPNRRI